MNGLHTSFNACDKDSHQAEPALSRGSNFNSPNYISYAKADKQKDTSRIQDAQTPNGKIIRDINKDIDSEYVIISPKVAQVNRSIG